MKIERKKLLRNIIITCAFLTALGILVWKLDNKNTSVLGMQKHEIKIILMPTVSPTPTQPTIILQYTPTPTKQIVQSTVTPRPLVDCTGPDGKHLQVTKKECNDFNNSWAKPTPGPTDPIVICQISSQCGGGNQYIKQSVCTAMTCCQVGDVWAIYPSKQSCVDAQNLAQPTITPTPTPSKEYLLQQCLNQALEIYKNTHCDQIVKPFNETDYSNCLANRDQVYKSNTAICNSSYGN